MQQIPGSASPATTEDALVTLMMNLGRRFRARLDGDTVEPSQAALLYTLKHHGGMRLGDIAETMKLDASTVSRHVQQLGDRGLIDRDPDPRDGRASIVSISADGLANLRHTFDQRRAMISAALADWDTGERNRLRDDLIRLSICLGDL